MANRSSTQKVQEAASDARRSLAGIADLAMRMIRRQVLGFPRKEEKEDLAFAELRVFDFGTQHGAYKKAQADIDTIRNDRGKYTDSKADAATATATPDIETAYTTAIAAMTAMGLSAARTQQLTTIIRTLTDSAEASLASSNKDAAKSGANECLNRSMDAVQVRIDAADAKHDRYKQAVIDEGARLGILI